MKLTQKLALAFLFVSLIAIGLAAAFVGINTAIRFNAFIVDQRQSEFIAVVTQHYRTQDTWSGVDAALRAQGLLPPIAQPGSKQPDPQPFALADQNRVVIIPGGEYRPGEKIQKGTLDKGVAIEINGRVVGTVLTTGQTPVRNKIEQKYIDSVYQSLLIAAFGGALMALLLGWFLARALTRPIRELTNATHEMAHGNLEQQVPVRSKDELGELAESFNQMSTDLARSNQARKQMTADIAHDLRNPLTVIGGYLESLQDGKLKPTAERFATMLAEVQQLQRLVEDLRTLSLADAGELKLKLQSVGPAELLEQAAATYRHQAEQQKINLQVNVESNLPAIHIDPKRLGQVLGNLISNALRYTPEHGSIQLNARKDQAGLILQVADTGTGIAPEILPHIFERSYRGDASRSGSESGLGLAIAKSIIELHGGSIRVESSADAGTKFLITIPV